MGNFGGFDFGSSFDDIVQAAREFGEKMKDMRRESGPFGFDSCFEQAFEKGPHARFYPPVNVYSVRDGSLVLEFALAGIDESAVSVEFQGDYLVLSAKTAERETDADTGGYSRHGFRPRDIDRQKYRVPADDYLQEQAKAVFKNGVLTVTVPPKQGEGIKVEIVKEGN
jgi:HSP20 family molecular chaperone IbpA